MSIPKKFSIGQTVTAPGKKFGLVIETAAPGEKISGTSKGLENRYRIKWYGGARTWMRESILTLCPESELSKNL